MAREVVSGVGKGAKRTDLGNVAKIQRSAKIQNAAGGAYGERGALNAIASQAPMPSTGSAVSAQAPAPTAPTVKPVDVFTPTNGLLTDGAGNNTLGTPPSPISAGLQSPDAGRVLATALFKAYPNPYTRANLEAFDAEGIY
jgi:hypothetical protein